MRKFSVIVPAYNEMGINALLRSLLDESPPRGWQLDRIFVMAGGYRGFPITEDRRIEVVEERLRGGKARALDTAIRMINSQDHSRMRPDVIIVQSGDTLPRKGLWKALLCPFDEGKVGLTCGRPVSLDDRGTFLGFLNNLVWDMHHIISTTSPKAGEVFAFRNIITSIPSRLAADEAYVESFMIKEGYSTRYCKDAVVFNHGPSTLSGFVGQRRRIYSGHMHIQNKYGYRVATMSASNLLFALRKYASQQGGMGLKKAVWLFFAAAIEAYSRILGAYDYIVKDSVPYKWEIIKTEGR